MTEQLPLVSEIVKKPIRPSLAEASKAGEPVAKFLENLGAIAASPYFIYGIFTGIQDAWWPLGIGLLGTSAAIYGGYEKFYSSYDKKPAEDKLAILKKVTSLQKTLSKRPRIVWE